MYCKNCGAHVDDDVRFCPKCGNRLKGYAQPPAQSQSGENQTNTYAIVGLILAFFIPIVGFILSIVGLSKAKELGGSGSGLATAGIIVSLIDVVAVILIVVVSIGLIAL